MKSEGWPFEAFFFLGGAGGGGGKELLQGTKTPPNTESTPKKALHPEKRCPRLDSQLGSFFPVQEGVDVVLDHFGPGNLTLVEALVLSGGFRFA